MSAESLIQELILLFTLTKSTQLHIESIEIIDEFGNKVVVK
jgi:hypothetical protein